MADNDNVMSQMKRLDRKITRKRVLLGAGGAAAAVAAGAAGLTLSGTRAGNVHAAPAKDNVSGDTPTQIFTAALIAEDLATTFYYNGLIGPVIQNPNLAGPGGTATNPNPTKSNPGNVDYLRAAISEEIDHANLFRALLGITGSANDPVQTFYFPAGSFDTLKPFLGLLHALESAFVGAYLNATKEFAQMAADEKAELTSYAPYGTHDLEYFAQVASSIMGIEAEHRVLGHVIGNFNPANDLCFEQLDGIRSVYNGSNSAVAALTPFLTSSTGPAYSFQTAVQNAGSLSLPCHGGLPPK